MKAYAFYLLSFVMLSCTSQNRKTSNHKADYNYYLKEVAEVRFPLDDKTPDVSHYLQSFTDRATGKELLVYLNEKKPSVIYFDVSKQSVFKEVTLKTRGSDGVGDKPTGILTLAWDSIYVIAAYSYTISLIDSAGKLLKQYPLLEGRAYNENTGLISSIGSPAVGIKDKLYFVSIPDRNAGKKSYYDAHTASTLNLVTGKFEYINNFPNEMRDIAWGNIGIGQDRTFNTKDSVFVSSFQVADSLVVWYADNQRMQRYFAGSRYKQKEVKPFEGDYTEDRIRAHYMESLLYVGIVFDPYRDVYYRLVWHAVPVGNVKGGKTDFNNKPLSVIILDKSFNIIGETVLKENAYCNYMFFVGKQGLYVAKLNPQGSDRNVDHIAFSCFKMERI